MAALLLVLTAAPARAQTTDKALAEELFREGQGLMRQQRYAEACPKLAESQRLDPSTGTLLNLAACHERQGKTASAWAEYSEVVTFARRDGREDRVAYSQDRLKALEPQLSRLSISLSPAADVPGLRIELDGNIVGRPVLGVAAPIDPGAHLVAASAPGKKPWQETVQVLAGPAQQDVMVPPLADAPAAEANSKALEPSASAKRPGQGQRIVAYTLGGAGVVGAIVGTIFGLNAISKNRESDDKGCRGDTCTPEAGALRNEALTAGNISTVSFIVGSACLAAGTVLFVTAPGKKQRAAAPRLRVAVAPYAGLLEVSALW